MAKILLVILRDGNREIRTHGVSRVIVDRAIQELVAYGEDGQVKERFRLSEVKMSRFAPDNDPGRARHERRPASGPPRSHTPDSIGRCNGFCQCHRRRRTEDRPNPLYRRVCYTFAWSAVVTFAVLNVAGLIIALATGGWYLRQLYETTYFTIAVTIWLLGALGRLPRVKPSTKGEGHERRYFYGSVWAVCSAQPVVWFLWAALPQTSGADAD